MYTDASMRLLVIIRLGLALSDASGGISPEGGGLRSLNCDLSASGRRYLARSAQPPLTGSVSPAREAAVAPTSGGCRPPTPPLFCFGGHFPINCLTIMLLENSTRKS